MSKRSQLNRVRGGRLSCVLRHVVSSHITHRDDAERVRSTRDGTIESEPGRLPSDASPLPQHGSAVTPAADAPVYCRRVQRRHGDRRAAWRDRKVERFADTGERMLNWQRIAIVAKMAAAESARPSFSVSVSSSGQGEIRTLDTVAGMPVFETGAFSHSATCPEGSQEN